MSTFRDLDKALRWLRLKQHRKQVDVARAAGITQAMLCSYEQGKRLPSVATLGKVLATLEVGLGELEEALAQVRGEGWPAPGRRRPSAPPASSERSGELERILGKSGPLPAAKREAFRQIVDGFHAWLRILDRSTPDSAPTSGTSGESLSPKTGIDSP